MATTTIRKVPSGDILTKKFTVNYTIPASHDNVTVAFEDPTIAGYTVIGIQQYYTGGAVPVAPAIWIDTDGKLKMLISNVSTVAGGQNREAYVVLAYIKN